MLNCEGSGIGHFFPSCEKSYLSDLKPARTSSEKSFGCSQAVKWPPFGELVVMDEFGIGPLRPAPRGWIEFVREDAHDTPAQFGKFRFRNIRT